MQERPYASGGLHGATVLVVDDEFLIALNLKYLLRGAGAAVRIETTLDSAVKAASSGDFSAALLDIRLGRDSSEPVAAALSERGIPFLFFSAHAVPEPMRARFPQAVTLTKPLGIHQVLSETQAMIKACADAKGNPSA